MPRPTRIQYEHAMYHVMNRGRGRQTIFHNKEYYEVFLRTLEEAHLRFDAIIYAYCLMDNHYHLMVETPRANLDRIMRHVNGVYTQRYNRLKKTDGPLFRGRYKAILVDKDAYLLQLSRYVHRNPVEVKGASSDGLMTYRWSSYLAYINRAKPKCWLEREKVYQMLGHRHKYAGYRAYVEAGMDEELDRFYSKGHIATVLGDQGFRKTIAGNKANLKVSGDLYQSLTPRLSAASIVRAVAEVFDVSESSITNRKVGRQRANSPRKFGMYCCQHLGDMSLKSIISLFGLKHEGSVSPAIYDIQQCLARGKLIQQLSAIEQVLDFIKRT